MAMYRCPKGSGEVELVPWATGTDDQIKAMVDAYYTGELSLADIQSVWSIGDERTVALSAMAATGVGESHVAQNVQMVIMNWGGKKLASDGTTDVLAIVGQKGLLNNGSDFEGGYMNSSNTNVGGWKDCARRSWCNNVYRNAVTSTTMRNLFKQFINQSGLGNNARTGVEDTTDYFALPAEIEVFGSSDYSISGEGTQFEYYENSDNIIKYYVGSSSYNWWERSPHRRNDRNFCIVVWTGSNTYQGALTANGLAPFGCI